MKHLLAASIERTLPRLAPAVLLLLLGYLTSPREVGIYSFAVLGYTLFQALTEGAVRQALPQMVSSPEGNVYLRNYTRLVVAIGPVILVVYISAVCVAAGATVDEWLQVLPIAVVPAITALGLSAVGRLQVSNAWATLARGQLLASVAGLSVGVGVLLVTQSLLGSSLALLVIEAVVASWNYWRAPRQVGVISKSFHGRTIGHLSLYSGLAWLQAQSDRVLVGAFGGAQLLGAYSMSLALARSPGEATASATANVLRARVSNLDVRGRDRLLTAGVLVSTMFTGMFLGFTYFVILPFLGPEWQQISGAVLILGICAVPTVLNWSAVVVHLERGTTKRALIAPMLGVAAGVGIGVAATVSLEFAAWICVIREFLLLTTTYALLGSKAPWRPFTVAAGITIVVSVIVVSVQAGAFSG